MPAKCTGLKNLCMAGGVALNCVANGIILREKIFEQIWIQPAAGDAGGALGAALAAWYANKENSRDCRGQPIRCKLRCLAPDFPMTKLKPCCVRTMPFFKNWRPDALLEFTVGLLKAEKVIGWFQGRMEFGPRALGNRSILGDARSPKMQSVMNLKVKFRESFRPFAPIVRRERVADYFELDADRLTCCWSRR